MHSKKSLLQQKFQKKLYHFNRNTQFKRVWFKKWSNWTFEVGQKNPTPTPSVVRNPTATPPKNLRLRYPDFNSMATIPTANYWKCSNTFHQTDENGLKHPPAARFCLVPGHGPGPCWPSRSWPSSALACRASPCRPACPGSSSEADRPVSGPCPTRSVLPISGD